jgi:hypothetical protein
MLIGKVAKRDFGVLWSRSFCLKISKSNLNFPTPDDDIWQRTFGGPSEVESNEIGVLHNLLNIIASMTVSLYYTDETHQSVCVCLRGHLFRMRVCFVLYFCIHRRFQ